MRPVPEQARAAYLVAASAGDVRSATRVATDLVEDGVSLRSLVLDLFSWAQAEAGARWHRSEWTVADEHLVTTTSAAVLEVLAAVDFSRPAASARGTVLVACAEGEWHTMPARLLGELVRDLGWDVRFLGASTPAEHVGALLGRTHPAVLAVSCSLPLNLAGVARLAEVAHAAGVPVLVGGRAIGGRRGRAVRVGADATIASIDDLDDVLTQMAGRPVTAEPVRLDAHALDLDASADELAMRAMDGLRQRFPAMAHYDARQLSRTIEDLAYIVRYAAAAVLVDDDDIWHEFRSWQVELLAARGVPEAAFLAGVAALCEVLPDGRGRELLRAAVSEERLGLPE